MHSDTQRLTSASLELSSRDERRRRTATFVAVLLALLVAGGGAFYLREGAAGFPSGEDAAALARENAALRADLERLRTELDVEKATRAELNREAGELHARINELTNRLEFLAARDARVDQPR